MEPSQKLSPNFTVLGSWCWCDTHLLIAERLHDGADRKDILRELNENKKPEFKVTEGALNNYIKAMRLQAGLESDDDLLAFINHNCDKPDAQVS